MLAWGAARRYSSPSEGKCAGRSDGCGAQLRVIGRSRDPHRWILLGVRLAIASVIRDGALTKSHVVANNAGVPGSLQKLRKGTVACLISAQGHNQCCLIELR